MKAIVRLVATLALAANASAAVAQNRLANPDFDNDVLGWSADNPGNSAIVWNASNKVGAPGSGAAFLYTPKYSGNWNVSSTCIALAMPAGSQWDYGGWIDLPSAQAGSGSTGIGVVFYSTGNCSLPGAVTGDFLHGPSVVFDQWTFYAKRITLPADANSALVYLNIDQNTNNVQFGALFDGIFLSDAIFVNGFEGP